MRRTVLIAVLAAAWLGLATSVPALAHGGKRHPPVRTGVSVGVVIGAPVLWHYHVRPRYYWPAPVYYYPAPVYYYPPVTVAPAPQVYIERNDAPAAADAATGWWYYCPEAQAYYPYVRECAKGWQRVPPQPPPG
jgi:hypothetical protein